MHGGREEEAFMKPPYSFQNVEAKGKVHKLIKALYGLKQSPRAWFERFRLFMVNNGYTQSQSDHTSFVKHDKNKVTALIVYVDDIVVTVNDAEAIKILKLQLTKDFEIKDLGPLKYFLGIKVARSPRGIFLSQMKYVLDLLTKTNMLGCKPATTPINPNHILTDAQDVRLIDVGKYQSLVGRMIYLSLTSPDIADAVNVVNQFMHAPTMAHLEATYQILKYLKGCLGKGVFYASNGHLRVEAYIDADWA